MIQMLFALFLTASSPEDVEMTTEWFVTVTENEVPRTLEPTAPGNSGDFSFGIDQEMAPGWACKVRPEIWHGTRRWRWVTCNYREGRATVQIRTDCSSNRSSSRSQELWLGDKVSVTLSCRSGVSP